MLEAINVRIDESRAMESPRGVKTVGQACDVRRQLERKDATCEWLPAGGLQETAEPAPPACCVEACTPRNMCHVSTLFIDVATRAASADGHRETFLVPVYLAFSPGLARCGKPGRGGCRQACPPQAIFCKSSHCALRRIALAIVAACAIVPRDGVRARLLTNA